MVESSLALASIGSPVNNCIDCDTMCETRLHLIRSASCPFHSLLINLNMFHFDCCTASGPPYIMLYTLIGYGEKDSYIARRRQIHFDPPMVLCVQRQGPKRFESEKPPSNGMQRGLLDDVNGWERQGVGRGARAFSLLLLWSPEQFPQAYGGGPFEVSQIAMNFIK